VAILLEWTNTDKENAGDHDSDDIPDLVYQRPRSAEPSRKPLVWLGRKPKRRHFRRRHG
jgi:hypothetical protein